MENYGNKISSGNICDVYLFEDPGSGAKKIFKVFEAGSHEFYKIESDIMQKYKIINFPMLIGAFSDENRYVIETEYIEGMTILEEVMKNGAIEKERSIKILRLVVMAIQRFYLVSENKYVFCDISPSNIILRKDGEISIIDLNSICRKGEKFKTASLFFSEEGGFNEHKTDVRSDIFSIGRLYYFMLTGRLEGTNTKKLDKFSEDIVLGCTTNKEILTLEDLLKTIDIKKTCRKTHAIFKRDIAVTGSGEFALELSFALKDLGYIVRINKERHDSCILDHFFNV